METIDGKWIMNGCADSDPECIKTADELADLIKNVGFLPLFSNEIRGFSVEERTSVTSWWTGDPDIDPWEWRIILSRHPEIVYGKFFDKKAGFVHKDVFPYFANYRRNGYDFDALYEDGLASFRANKIMTAMELDEEAVGTEILSNELKDKAGFGKKDGEKNFSGILTDLQMQTYLIAYDFRQRKNKKGEEYGWHIACMATPETKWGYDYIATGYKEDPEASWQRIVDHMHQHFLEVEDDMIWKVLGISYNHAAPKPAKVKKKAVRGPKTWIIPANPKYYDIIHAFDHTDVINWKQGAGIKEGDTVFLYVAAPFSAIFYQCEVLETDIPYEFADENLTIKTLMKIRLLRRYDPEKFTFEVLKKEYSIFAVRGPRGIPDALKEALDK